MLTTYATYKCLSAIQHSIHPRADTLKQADECCVDPQAVKVLNMIKVFGKPIRVNKASQDKRSQDVGANLFIGNLDPRG